MQVGVVLRDLLQVFDGFLYVVRQALDVANHAEADVILHEYLVFQRCEHQAH